MYFRGNALVSADRAYRFFCIFKERKPVLIVWLYGKGCRYFAFVDCAITNKKPAWQHSKQETDISTGYLHQRFYLSNPRIMNYKERWNDDDYSNDLEDNIGRRGGGLAVLVLFVAFVLFVIMIIQWISN